MKLPFAQAEFLQVFADYNTSIWPLQPFAAALGVVAVLLVFPRKAWADRSIAAILASFWLLTGIGYHWSYFADINPAAYLFGGLFVIAALIFLVEGTVRNRIRFEFSPDRCGWSAAALVAYALVIYPAAGLFALHPYPETPLFGVAPCPTTIFTLGLLLIAKHPRPALLGAVPVLWAATGGMAAVVLHIPQDWGLLVAGALWLVLTRVGGLLPGRS